MKRLILFILWLTFATPGMAQCPTTNTAFKSGETLTYKLFFNWKFVWVGAGNAVMSTTQEEGKGYRSSLVTHTSKRIDRFFMMRDTLLSIVDQDMVPQYYRKAANEGGKYYVDQVWYNYKNGQTHLKQRYQNRRGEISDTTHQSTSCIYDMMSMMLRARSFDVTNFKEGQKILFPMADGDQVEQVTLIYRGKKTYRMEETDIRYRCLVFSFVEYEDKKEKEIITFYITDDANHAPVRLDLFLKFGVAKAYLSKAEGLRNPQTSIIK